MTNGGTEPVTLAAVSLTGPDAGEFERLTSEGADCVPTRRRRAGETCDLRATLDPLATGAKTATMTVEVQCDDDHGHAERQRHQSRRCCRARRRRWRSDPSDIDDGPSRPADVDRDEHGQPAGHDHRDHARRQRRERVSAGDRRDHRLRCGHDAAADEKCDLRARFDPDTTGAKSATLTVTSNAAAVTVALSGTGTQTQLSLAPATLAFGSKDIDEGPAAALTSTVKNSGSVPVTLTAITLGGSDPDQFQRLTGATADCTTTTTLTAGETCDLRARFDPTATGAKTATITVDSNADDITVTLTGTATNLITELSLAPATLPSDPRTSTTARPTRRRRP